MENESAEEDWMVKFEHILQHKSYLTTKLTKQRIYGRLNVNSYFYYEQSKCVMPGTYR